jgi:uncharacterized Zn finger protein (UPF0148 family)
MLIVKATCPNCGAPLGLGDGQQRVLCRYCNQSLRVEAPAAGAPVTETRLAKDAVAREDVDRVIQLVLDGERDGAIQHYARVAGLPPAEAEKAVDQLLQPSMGRLTRQLPINWFGFLLTFVVVGACAGGAFWSARAALDGSPAFWVLSALLSLGAVRQIFWFVPKAISTFVDAFGAEGQARVLKRAILRPQFVKGGSVVLLALEVHPAKGGAPFVDEETLLVRDESIGKLEPGNVIPVRYDEPARKRVFPVSPIEVAGRP